jgi:D-sedoheptulose 7-phosphate isomerase
MDYVQDIKEYLACEMKVLESLDIEALNRALALITTTWEKGGRIFCFGNGGSAATASHFQNDFNKGLSEYLDHKFRFCCLSDNIPTVLAIANDIGYEEIFRFQLRGVLTPPDIVLAISGSGNSPNVLYAAEYAREQGAGIIALTGYDGGLLGQLADIHLHVPVQSMQITEDIHMIFDHLFMSVLLKHLAGRDHLERSGNLPHSTGEQDNV